MCVSVYPFLLLRVASLKATIFQILLVLSVGHTLLNKLHCFIFFAKVCKVGWSSYFTITIEQWRLPYLPIGWGDELGVRRQVGQGSCVNWYRKTLLSIDTFLDGNCQRSFQCTFIKGFGPLLQFFKKVFDLPMQITFFN